MLNLLSVWSFCCGTVCYSKLCECAVCITWLAFAFGAFAFGAAKVQLPRAALKEKLPPKCIPGVLCDEVSVAIYFFGALDSRAFSSQYQ